MKHLTGYMFYTNNWNAFAAVLPSDRHIIGKSGTVTIEQDDSNTRHHLARFTRRIKVVSQKKEGARLGQGAFSGDFEDELI